MENIDEFLEALKEQYHDGMITSTQLMIKLHDELMWNVMNENGGLKSYDVKFNKEEIELVIVKRTNEKISRVLSFYQELKVM